MMKKVIGKTGRSRKGRRAAPWAVSLIISFQVLAWVFFSMVTPEPVEAKTFTVTSTLDEIDTAPGDGFCVSTSGCALRAAIQEANSFAGPDVIKLKTGLYMLTIAGRLEDACATGDLDITDDLAIIGTGAKHAFINGGKLDRVFHIIGPVSVSITNVAIQNGLATDGYGFMSDTYAGGGIQNSGGTLIIKGSTISNNTVSGSTGPMGGGIYNSGTLIIGRSTLSNSTISNNSVNTFSSPSSAKGGGICNGEFSTLTITGSTVSNNSASGNNVGMGGGIENIGTLIVIGCTISNNSASPNSASGFSYAGGIENNSGTLTVTQSIISNNTASGGTEAFGGGILNDVGPATITGSIISNNVARGDNIGWGGGIYGISSEVTVKGSTISGNAASGRFGSGTGGGIYLGDATLTVRNASKIVRNFASDQGGGIFIAGSSTANISSDSTVANNIPDDTNF
jgi:CSLREA domain-containing protein